MPHPSLPHSLLWKKKKKKNYHQSLSPPSPTRRAPLVRLLPFFFSSNKQTHTYTYLRHTALLWCYWESRVLAKQVNNNTNQLCLHLHSLHRWEQITALSPRISKSSMFTTIYRWNLLSMSLETNPKKTSIPSASSFTLLLFFRVLAFLLDSLFNFASSSVPCPRHGLHIVWRAEILSR